MVAQIQQSIDGAAANLVAEIGDLLVLRQRLVRARQRQGQSLRQFQLEIVPAFITDSAAKADHGRFRDMRVAGQCGQIL